MLTPQDVSIFLNNALKPAHYLAELDSDTALPEVIREMPDQVSGRFVALDATVTADMAAASKKIMILNATRVLYTFTFDSSSGKFTAQKR